MHANGSVNIQSMSKAVAAVYSHVVQSIETGELVSGEPVREEVVAEQTRVSRTPVREAFRILASDGWLEAKQNQGVRVTAWDARQIRELFDARALIEPYLLGIAAPRLSPSDLAQLTELAEEVAAVTGSSAGDATRRQEANDRFHTLLVERAEQKVLADLLNKMRNIPLGKRTIVAYSDKERLRSNDQHFEIIEAIRGNDVELAQAIMRAHLLHGKHAALRTLCANSPGEKVITSR